MGQRSFSARSLGLIARRIVCYKKAEIRSPAGERVGLIKFGSRVDVFIGPEWELMVNRGQRFGRVHGSGAQKTAT